MSANNKKLWVVFALVALIPATLSIIATYALVTYATTQEEQAGPPPGEMGGPPPASVIVAPVRQQTISRTQQITGRLREIRRAQVAAEVEGRITDLPVEVGDTVTAGQTLLARIDGIWASLDLEAAEAEIVSIQVSRDQAQRDLDQLIQLRETRSAVEKEVEDQRALVASYDAALRAAEARRNRARQSVERVEVLAPFDGRVTAKHAEVGEWAELGAELVEVVSTGQIDAEADVPESLVAQIEIGQQVEVEIESLGTVKTGEIVAIAPDADNMARTFPVKIRLDDHDGKLLAGMSVQARMPVGPPADVLLVPRDAVQFGTGTPTVWIVVPTDSMPMTLPVVVNILFPYADGYAVRQAPGGPQGPPLMPGTSVVTQGAEWLFPTRPLILQPEDTQTANAIPQP
ncbi:efflux RND transporter periplasmic adaptor subunit [Mucisphaera sp.]|uniref:efflux RND transporter periplasmic adaptor subunit n=1 Tax=Mucisphaera sp. TaxID=2913024 RepID=UPI003D107C7D